MAKAATVDRASGRPQSKSTASDRAFRGLFLPLLLSLVNFVGLVVSATSIGVDGWSTWQFAAMFGTLEAAAGISGVILPNVWHLPVVELESSARNKAELSLPSVMVPHWGGLARAVAGVALIVAAGYSEGFGSSAALIAPLIVLLTIAMTGLSLLVARIGVARPDVDVVQFLIKWKGKVNELKPLSISTSALQFFLGIITLPLASVARPSQLFAEGPGPQSSFVAIIAIGTLVIMLATVAAWWGRISKEAPAEQQREVEENA